MHVRARACADIFYEQLRAFLRQREIEMSGAGNVVMENQMHMSAPPLIQTTPIETIRGYLATLNDTLALLNGPKLRQVLDIKYSHR